MGLYDDVKKAIKYVNKHREEENKKFEQLENQSIQRLDNIVNNYIGNLPARPRANTRDFTVELNITDKKGLLGLLGVGKRRKHTRNIRFGN